MYLLSYSLCICAYLLIFDNKLKFSFRFRVTVLGVLLGILEWDHSVTCILLLWEYVLGYLGLFVASMIVEFSICILATRGSILDTAARAPMQHLLYIRLCKFIMCWYFDIRYFYYHFLLSDNVTYTIIVKRSILISNVRHNLYSII